LKREALDLGWQKLSIWNMIKVLPFVLSGRMVHRIKALYIPVEKLSQLKQQVMEKSGCRCSAHVALSAYLTKMFIQLFGHPGNTRCYQVTAMDMRKRLPNMPPVFAGNASITVATPVIRADADIGEIARIIHHTLAPLLKPDSGELLHMVSLFIDMINHRIPIINFDVSEMHTRKPHVIYINNFSKFPLYDVDFGTGKPSAVIPHNLGDPVLIWPAHPSRGGVEVYFSGIAAHGIHSLPDSGSWFEKVEKSMFDDHKILSDLFLSVVRGDS
jgi:hypothetical protein